MKGKKKAAMDEGNNEKQVNENGEELEVEVEYEGDEENEENEEEEEEGKEERPKLDEGFFEIEAIRRKKVHKGQLLYLIKWRGWPETANTWEPLENLESCSDVIDAFEESLRSGKSSRKRKRKSGSLHNQPKKKQSRSSVTYNAADGEIGFADKTLLSVPPNNPSITDLGASVQHMASGHEGENNRDINMKTVGQANEYVLKNGSKILLETKEDNEYDPKLSELRGTMSTNDVNGDKLAIHFHDGKALEGNGPTNGLVKVDHVEPLQSSCRTGSKRRKSGPVKRFKKDSAMCEPSPFLQNSPSNIPGSGYMAAQLGIENTTLTWNNSNQKPISEDSVLASTIVRIVKPIGFAASVLDNVQDVQVTFVAMRSDGTEVIVDNKFLKDNNPLLLINFYEQHLKYST